MQPHRQRSNGLLWRALMTPLSPSLVSNCLLSDDLWLNVLHRQSRRHRVRTSGLSR